MSAFVDTRLYCVVPSFALYIIVAESVRFCGHALLVYYAFSLLVVVIHVDTWFNLIIFLH